MHTARLRLTGALFLLCAYTAMPAYAVPPTVEEKVDHAYTQLTAVLENLRMRHQTLWAEKAPFEDYADFTQRLIKLDVFPNDMLLELKPKVKKPGDKPEGLELTQKFDKLKSLTQGMLQSFKHKDAKAGPGKDGKETADKKPDDKVADDKQVQDNDKAEKDLKADGADAPAPLDCNTPEGCAVIYALHPEKGAAKCAPNSLCVSAISRFGGEGMSYTILLEQAETAACLAFSEKIFANMKQLGIRSIGYNVLPSDFPLWKIPAEASEPDFKRACNSDGPTHIYLSVVPQLAENAGADSVP